MSGEAPETTSAVIEAVRQAFAPVAEIEAIRRKILITPAEAAMITPWTVDALQKLRKESKGPRFVQRGKSIFYRPEDLADYALALRAKTTEVG